MPLLAALLLATAVHAQSDAVDALFANKYGPRTPGVAVAVIRDGQVAYQKGYGAANLEHGIAVTPSTVFQLGSVSKQFTAFAVYLLEKQGKLSLEDDVRKHLPELPRYSSPIRIQHLLGHTSGVRDQASLLSLAGWRMDDVATTAQVMRLITRQSSLNFEPGSAYLYSNSGYTLLAEIVRRASGLPLADYAKRNIFEPLGMHSTQFLDDHEAILRNRADSYERDGNVYKRVNLLDAVPGPSNLYSTVEDMAKWALNFDHPTVGDPELIRRFNEPSLLNNGEKAVYYSQPGDIGYHAKGQVCRVYRGLEVRSHGGHAGGFRSTFWRFPGQRFAVVLLSNDEHFAQLDNAEAIVNAYLKDQLQPLPSPAPASPSQPKPQAPTPVSLTQFQGRFYNAELDTAYTARTTGDGKLILSHIRHGDIALTAAGTDTFTGRIQFPVEIRFLRDPNGRIHALQASNFGARNVIFHKYELPPPKR